MNSNDLLAFDRIYAYMYAPQRYKLLMKSTCDTQEHLPNNEIWTRCNNQKWFG